MTKKTGGRQTGTSDFRKRPKGTISPRAEKVLECRLLMGLTLADSAAAAGYKASSRRSAKSIAEKIIAKHGSANAEFQEALGRQNVTFDKLAEVLAAGLDATMKVNLGDELVEVPDWACRHLALTAAISVMGAKSPLKAVLEREESFERRLMKIAIEDEQTERATLPE